MGNTQPKKVQEEYENLGSPTPAQRKFLSTTMIVIFSIILLILVVGIVLYVRGQYKRK
jgi:membrane protein insertase Oxa1/YidC/SpoIIIJ